MYSFVVCQSRTRLFTDVQQKQPRECRASFLNNRCFLLFLPQKGPRNLARRHASPEISRGSFLSPHFLPRFSVASATYLGSSNTYIRRHRRCSGYVSVCTFNHFSLRPCFAPPPFPLPRTPPVPPRSPYTDHHPQKPYLPLGSLRAQMLYPRSEDEALSTPATLEGILEQVQLGYLCSRFGGLGANRDWQDELSLGEQQVSFWRWRLRGGTGTR